MCDIQSYPQEILPSELHVYPLKMDKLLLELIEVYMLRRATTKPEVLVFNGNTILKEDALVDTTGVLNYSLNLYGGAFKEEHLPWRQLGGSQEKWSEGNVNVENYEGQVRIISPCYKIFFKASILHNATIPYLRHFEKQREFEEHEKRAELLANKAVETWTPEHKDILLKGNTKLIHDPRMLNYWHYVLDTFPADKDEALIKDKSSWQKNMKGAVLSLLKMNPILETPCCEIPEVLYLQQSME